MGGGTRHGVELLGVTENDADGDPGAESGAFAPGDIVVYAVSEEITAGVKGRLVRSRWQGAMGSEEREGPMWGVVTALPKAGLVTVRFEHGEGGRRAVHSGSLRRFVPALRNRPHAARSKKFYAFVFPAARPLLARAQG